MYLDVARRQGLAGLDLGGVAGVVQGELAVGAVALLVGVDGESGGEGGDDGEGRGQVGLGHRAGNVTCRFVAAAQAGLDLCHTKINQLIDY